MSNHLSVGENKQLEITNRRQQIIGLLRDGMPQSEMAKLLDVSEGTISRDVKAIHEQAKQELRNRAPFMMTSELAKLDDLEREAKTNYAEAILKRDTCGILPVVNDEKAKKKPRLVDAKSWESYDRAAKRWWDAQIRVQERRAKLMGLDLQQSQQESQAPTGVTFIFEGPRKNAQPVPVILENDDRDD